MTNSNLGNKEIISQNIRHYMNINDKDRVQVCSDLNIKYSTFNEWYNAKKYPRIDKIELLANYFGVNKSDLVEKRVCDNKPQLKQEYAEFAQMLQDNNISIEDMKKIYDLFMEFSRKADQIISNKE